MQFFKGIWLFILLTVMSFVSQAAETVSCGDLLSQFNKKPAIVEYQSCEILTDLQGKPMIATYKVTGDKAATVEGYLVKVFDMPALKFICCGWEPVENLPDKSIKLNGHYSDPKTGIFYSIAMGSGETLVSDRQNWSEIPYFYIKVKTFTDPDEI